jgi:glycosyltransferase involved in cell wall biosynthesis
MASVDVVVPCYNYGHYLASCVRSILTQAGVELRVLILDDASSDETPDSGADLAQADRRVTFRRHGENKGHISTYNEGIEWTSADYILLLSADDYLLPGALARATTLMENFPDVGFTFGRAFLERESEPLERVYPLGRASAPDGRRILTGAQFIARAGAKNIVPTPTVVVRTSLQKQVGGYRHDLPHSGDMEMWFRLAARALVGYVDSDQAVYRQHATNMSRRYAAAMLPDLEQRKAALDQFFLASIQLLPNAELLRSNLLRDLACHAVGRASQAFNIGELLLSDQIMGYATEIDPGIVNSPFWWRVNLKRRIGSRAWRSIDRLRHGWRRIPPNDT